MRREYNLLEYFLINCWSSVVASVVQYPLSNFFFLHFAQALIDLPRKVFKVLGGGERERKRERETSGIKKKTRKNTGLYGPHAAIKKKCTVVQHR